MKSIAELEREIKEEHNLKAKGISILIRKQTNEIIKLIEDEMKRFQGRNSNKSKLVWDVLSELISKLKGEK